MGWAAIDRTDVQNRQSADAIGGHSTLCGGKTPAGRTGVVLAILGSGYAMTIQSAPITHTGMTLSSSGSGANRSRDRSGRAPGGSGRASAARRTADLLPG